MRIVAGAAKGRRLAVPRGDHVRPTADRVKEALFASLQHLLPGARVLDLYAGGGGLGLEALSRGAASVTLVERDRRALTALRRNVEVVALPGAQVVAAPVERSLASPLPGGPFDLVVADPPYAVSTAELGRVLAALIGQLASRAVVVVERPTRGAACPWPPGLVPTEERRYGETTLHRAVAD